MWAKSCATSLMIIALLAARTVAQEKKDDGKDPVNPIPFEATEVGINVCAMIACVGSAPGDHQPWGLIGTRVLASWENVPLTKWQFSLDTVFPLNQTALDLIQDGRLLPDLRLKELKELPLPDRSLYVAYNDALHYSGRATREMFEKSAGDFEHVFYRHLAADPKRYRGKIITIQGKLNAIEEYQAPSRQRELNVVYTGFVIGPTKGAPPYSIVFTELPEGILKPTPNFNREVKFSGYFLAFVRYPADKEKGRTKKDVVSPWLIGKTVTVMPDEKKVELPPEDRTANSYYIIVWTVGGIVGVALLVALMNVWFGRGDREVKSRLAEMRDRQQPFNFEAAEEPPPPPADEGVKPEPPPP